MAYIQASCIHKIDIREVVVHLTHLLMIWMGGFVLQPVRRKSFLGRCLTSNQTPRIAIANSFESRLKSRSLSSLPAENHEGSFQF